jgi:magnesium-transporting ATPase (P-type)
MGGIMDQYDATNINNIMNESDIDKNNTWVTYISSIVQILLYYYGFYKMKISENEENINSQFYNIMLNVYFLNLCFWAISYIPGFGSMNRMPAYFEFGYPFCIVLTMLYFRKINKPIFAIILFIGTFTLKYRALNLGGAIGERNINIFVPYKSFMEKDEPMRSGIWIY